MRSRMLKVSLAVVVLGALGLPGIPATAQVIPPATHPDLASWVDPMIGTFPPGFVSPGPVLPHGMVGLGPDTGEGPVNYGGYYRHNALVTGFSHTHMSTGGVQGGQVPLMPITGEPTAGDLANPFWPQPVPAYSSPVDHATEVAEPGYYSALLARYGVTRGVDGDAPSRDASLHLPARRRRGDRVARRPRPQGPVGCAVRSRRRADDHRKRRRH